MFVGREKELKQLNSAFSSHNKELGVIYGRRRIGKTKLIDQFVKDKPHLFYQAKEDSSLFYSSWNKFYKISSFASATLYLVIFGVQLRILRNCIMKSTDLSSSRKYIKFQNS